MIRASLEIVFFSLGETLLRMFSIPGNFELPASKSFRNFPSVKGAVIAATILPVGWQLLRSLQADSQCPIVLGRNDVRVLEE
jgi:hypothetical protein